MRDSGVDRNARRLIPDISLVGAVYSMCAQQGHLFRMKLRIYLEGVSLPTMMSGQALVGGSDVSNR